LKLLISISIEMILLKITRLNCHQLYIIAQQNHRSKSFEDQFFVPMIIVRAF